MKKLFKLFKLLRSLKGRRSYGHADHWRPRSHRDAYRPLARRPSRLGRIREALGVLLGRRGY